MTDYSANMCISSTEHRALALNYLPIIHYDYAETIPLQLVGYTVLEESCKSPSFRRELKLPPNCQCIIEYAFYWNYDIQHMYDLEHIWCYVGNDGMLTHAEGSFHGHFLNLYAPEIPCIPPTNGRHVHAYCQPGKHAFLPDGNLFRLYPFWEKCCTDNSGGKVLVGSPFNGIYEPSNDDNLRCNCWIRSHLSFRPTLKFEIVPIPEKNVISWDELYNAIPTMIVAECTRLKGLINI